MADRLICRSQGASSARVATRSNGGTQAARDTRTILELADVKIATPECAEYDAHGDARAQALVVIEAARILSVHRLWPASAELG